MGGLMLNPDFVFREDNDGGLIFDPSTGDVRVLNETAAFICRLLNGTHTVGEITAAVLEEFDIEDAEAARQEVASFVEGLQERSMVKDA